MSLTLVDYRKAYARAVGAPRIDRPLPAIQAICFHHIAAKRCEPDRLLAILKQRGGLGYHFYIRSNGQTFQLAELWAVMFHNGGGPRSKFGNFSAANYSQIGVALEGDFSGRGGFETRPDSEPTHAQLNAARDLVAHKDYARTACPGTWWTSGRPDRRLIPAGYSPAALAGPQSLSLNPCNPSSSVIQTGGSNVSL